MKIFRALLATTACCSVDRFSASAFQPHFSRPASSRTPATKLSLAPEIQEALPSTAAVILSSDGESWRQYVPLGVSVGVIVDILLGSPIANLALAPMKRASENGATDDAGGAGGSPFSAASSAAGARDRARERVDSTAIAQAALDKATNTLELKRFLEENKTDEQKFEDVRKKIDRQMSELDEEE